MTRVADWFRFLRWWFTAHRELSAQVVRLDRTLVDERAEHYGQMADASERYARDVADLRQDIAAFRMECERREQDLAEAERRVHAERVKGNEAWQEAGIQRRRADGLQVELDRFAGAEVEHAAARD